MPPNKAIDLFVKAQNLISIGREKLWRKFGYDRIIPILDNRNSKILLEETDKVIRAVMQNKKLQLLAELIGVAAFTTSWIEALVSEYDYCGYSFSELQHFISEEVGLNKIMKKELEDASKNIGTDYTSSVFSTDGLSSNQNSYDPYSVSFGLSKKEV